MTEQERARQVRQVLMHVAATLPVSRGSSKVFIALSRLASADDWILAKIGRMLKQ